jgi:hypothetical protein
MASGQAQQTATLGAGTVVLNDAMTVVVNGVSYIYNAVAADVSAGGVAATAARIAAGWNALATFAALYTATAIGLAIVVAANSFGNSTPSFSCFNGGTGTAGLTASGSALNGGDGGANVSIQSQGGAIGQAGAPAAVSVGGFVAQVGNTFTRGGIG